MLLPNKHQEFYGQIVRLEVESPNLANTLGDPTRRMCPVYLPPAYSANDSYPLLIELAAFSNSGLSRANWKNFSITLPQRIDRLIARGTMAPVVVAFPDCFSALGGSQFVDSPVIGQHARFIAEDLLPLLERTYRCGGRKGRGLFGHSSGGFGALHLAQQYRELWHGIISIAGDMGFSDSLRPMFATAAQTLDTFDQDLKAFTTAFWQREHPPGDWIMTLMMIALAASYDAPQINLGETPGDLLAGIALPFDPYTLEIDQARWHRWLAFDPLHWTAQQIDALRSLKYLHLACGRQDEFRAQYGARRFSHRLTQCGVDHDLAQFDGTHTKVDHRYDTSLPELVQAICA